MSSVAGFTHGAARGVTWHARIAPKAHRFQYRSAMLYLDLDHLDQLRGSKLKINQPGIFSFQTKRHLCDNASPSGDSARAFVLQHLAIDVSGPVKLLTNAHCCGIGFNPLSVYFLHDTNDQPAALIYEVSNTPWNEIHRYVIPYDDLERQGEYWFEKTFHVSPFNPVNQRYMTRVEWPRSDRVSVYLGLQDHGQDTLMFEASLNLNLIPFDGRSVRPLFIGFWPQTFVVIGGIYREAFSLWRKGLAYHPHP